MSAHTAERPQVSGLEAPIGPAMSGPNATSYPTDMETLTVSRVGADRGAVAQLQHLAWADVLDVLQHPAIVGHDGTRAGRNRAKASAGAWVFGTFADGKRDKDHLLTRSALTVDLDHAVDLDAVRARLEAVGVTYAWHDTYNSTPGDRRLRVILPLSREVTELEYARLSHVAWARLDAEPDTTSDQASRIMYLPATPDPQGYAWGAGGAERLDVGAWLAEAPAVLPSASARPAVSSGVVGAAVTAEYVRAELDRMRADCLAALELSDGETDAQGRTWDAIVATAAYRIAGLTLTPQIGPDGSENAPWSADYARALFEAVVPEDMRTAEAQAGGVLGDKFEVKLSSAVAWPVPTPLVGPEAFGLTGRLAPAVVQPVATVVQSCGERSADLHVHNRVAYGLAVRQAGRHMHVGGVGWHEWDGTRWCADPEAVAIHQAVRAHLGELAQEAYGMEDESKRLDALKRLAQAASASGQDGVVKITRSLPEFAMRASDLDADPWLLNVANGTLNLRTLALQPHDPADRITKVARANYVPGLDWRGTRWGSFLGEVLPAAEVQGFVQRFVGQALIGKPVEHLMLVMTGEGRNGKGVFYKALGHALGDYAGTAEPQLLVARDRGSAGVAAGQMALRGRRWVTTSELEDGDSLSVGTTKRMTGGDPITAKYMGQNWVTFDPSHTVCMVTNHLPNATASDPALWERIRVVPFDVVVPPEQRDVHLDEKLNAAADAVLAWAVEGLHEYLTGGLGEAGEVSRATAEYRDDNDRVRRFVDEELEATAAPASTATELHRLYAAWCLADGATPDGRKTFSKQLQRLGHQTRATNRGTCYLLRQRSRGPLVGLTSPGIDRTAD